MQRWQELGKERRSVGSFGLRSDLPGGVRKRNKSKEKKTPRVLDLHLGGESSRLGGKSRGKAGKDTDKAQPGRGRHPCARASREQ